MFCFSIIIINNVKCSVSNFFILYYSEFKLERHIISYIHYNLYLYFYNTNFYILFYNRYDYIK